MKYILIHPESISENNFQFLSYYKLCETCLTCEGRGFTTFTKNLKTGSNPVDFEKLTFNLVCFVCNGNGDVAI